MVTRAIEGDKVLDVNVIGTRMVIHPVKEHGYLRASRITSKFGLLHFELPVILHLAGLLADGDTFVDAGANVGIFAHTLAQMGSVYPRCRFYAIEASPDTFVRLERGGIPGTVKALNLAVSDHEGVLEFVGGAVSNIFTTVDNASDYSIRSETIKVPCRRLDAMGLEGDSLIIKIDVEGQERQAIDGAEGLFKAGRVKAVYLDGYKDKQIMPILKSKGFKLLDGRTLEPVADDNYSLLAVRV